MSECPLRTLLTNLASTICGELEEAVHVTHTHTEMLGGFPRHRCSNSRSPLCLSTVLPHLTRCLCPAAHESRHDKSITTHLRPPPQVGYNCRVVGMGLLTGDLTSLMGTSHPKVRKSNVISGVATLGKGDGKDPKVVCASTACRARCSGGSRAYCAGEEAPVATAAALAAHVHRSSLPGGPGI